MWYHILLANVYHLSCGMNIRKLGMCHVTLIRIFLQACNLDSVSKWNGTFEPYHTSVPTKVGK